MITALLATISLVFSPLNALIYDSYAQKYASGENLQNEKNLRTTVISIYDVDKLPTVTAKGTENATVKADYSVSEKICTITVISDGLVNLNIN